MILEEQQESLADMFCMSNLYLLTEAWNTCQIFASLSACVKNNNLE